MKLATAIFCSSLKLLVWRFDLMTSREPFSLSQNVSDKLSAIDTIPESFSKTKRLLHRFWLYCPAYRPGPCCWCPGLLHSFSETLSHQVLFRVWMSKLPQGIRIQWWTVVWFSWYWYPSWAIAEVAIATRQMLFRYSKLCGMASDAVDAVRSAIPKGFKF